MNEFLEFALGGTGLEGWSAALMCGVSFAGSFITASLGLGGGLLVMATMASLLPPTVLIPLHGIVQLGSNAGRALIMRGDIMKSTVPPFLLGTLIGAFAGGQLVVTLPTGVLQVVLGTFVLYASWGPKLRVSAPGRKTFFGVGMFGAFATMFVGSTGPLVAPFAAAASGKRQEVVATHAALMTIQHGFKIVVFGVLGFAFAPFVPLLAGLLACGFVGTYAGKHMLNFMPEHIFRAALKAVITVLALRLLYKGIEGWL